MAWPLPSTFLWTIAVPTLGTAIILVAIIVYALVRNSPSGDHVSLNSRNGRRYIPTTTRCAYTSSTFKESFMECCPCLANRDDNDLQSLRTIGSLDVTDDQFEIVVEKLCVFRVPRSLVAESRVTSGKVTQLMMPTITENESEMSVPSTEQVPWNHSLNVSSVENRHIGDCKNVSDGRCVSVSPESVHAPTLQPTVRHKMNNKYNMDETAVSESNTPHITLNKVLQQCKSYQYDVAKNYLAIPGPSNLKVNPPLEKCTTSAGFRNKTDNSAPQIPTRLYTKFSNRDKSLLEEKVCKSGYGDFSKQNIGVTEHRNTSSMPPLEDDHIPVMPHLGDAYIPMNGEKLAINEDETMSNKHTYRRHTHQFVGDSLHKIPGDFDVSTDFDTGNIDGLNNICNSNDVVSPKFQMYSRSHVFKSHKRPLSPTDGQFDDRHQQNAKRKFAKLSYHQLQPAKANDIGAAVDRKSSCTSTTDVCKSEIMHGSESVNKLLYERISAKFRSRTNIPIAKMEGTNVDVSEQGERSPGNKLVSNASNNSDFFNNGLRNSAQPKSSAFTPRVTSQGDHVHAIEKREFDPSISESLVFVVDLDDPSNKIDNPKLSALAEVYNEEDETEISIDYNVSAGMSPYEETATEDSENTVEEMSKLESHSKYLKNTTNMHIVDTAHNQEQPSSHRYPVVLPDQSSSLYDQTELLTNIQAELMKRKGKWPVSCDSMLVYSDNTGDSELELQHAGLTSDLEEGSPTLEDFSESTPSFDNSKFRSEPVLNPAVDRTQTRQMVTKKYRSKMVPQQPGFSVDESAQHVGAHEGEFQSPSRTKSPASQPLRPVSAGEADNRTLQWTLLIKHRQFSNHEQAGDNAYRNERRYYAE